jgi:CYTH domain-containing protein
MEIERKFLVAEIPADLSAYPVRHLEQGYLSTDPVLRVRQSGDAYYLTYKGPGLLAREEHEFPLSEKAYQHLLAKADGAIITKDRYRIHWGAYTIELDVFAPPFAPLVLAEVEFLSEEEALAFQPPEWFGKEVTYDPSYTNARMSQRFPGQSDGKTPESDEFSHRPS